MFTQKEIQFFRKWKELYPTVDITNPRMYGYLRRQRRLAAFHEAGHAAALKFFTFDDGKFYSIEVSPCKNRTGVFYGGRDVWLPQHLMGYPESLRGVWSKQYIIFLLAGREAERKTGGEVSSILECDGLLEDGHPGLSEKEWRSASDESKAFTIAKLIEHPNWPAARILKKMEAWTKELMTIQVLWDVVESLATLLIYAGEITDPEDFDEITSPICRGWLNYPQWRRRFDKEIFTSVS